MNNQDLWKDKKKSEETMREISALKSRIEPIKTLSKRVEECEQMLELVEEADDP